MFQPLQICFYNNSIMFYIENEIEIEIENGNMDQGGGCSTKAAFWYYYSFYFKSCVAHQQESQ